MKKYKLAVFTKGELMDQENKLWRSGLQRYFDVVTIVSDKTPKAYHRLCRELDVTPDELVMVGNSFKSDIAPALKIRLLLSISLFIPHGRMKRQRNLNIPSSVVFQDSRNFSISYNSIFYKGL